MSDPAIPDTLTQAAERARIIAAAWHEYRYPRADVDEPPNSFTRAIGVALDEAAVRAPAVDRERLIEAIRDATTAHHVDGDRRLCDPGDLANSLLARGLVTTGQAQAVIPADRFEHAANLMAWNIRGAGNAGNADHELLRAVLGVLGLPVEEGGQGG